MGKKLQKNVTVKGEACILIHLYLLSSHLKTIGIGNDPLKNEFPFILKCVSLVPTCVCVCGESV